MAAPNPQLAQIDLNCVDVPLNTKQTNMATCKSLPSSILAGRLRLEHCNRSGCIYGVPTSNASTASLWCLWQIISIHCILWRRNILGLYIGLYISIGSRSTRGQTKSRTTNSRTGQLADTMLVPCSVWASASWPVRELNVRKLTSKLKTVHSYSPCHNYCSVLIFLIIVWGLNIWAN